MSICILFSFIIGNFLISSLGQTREGDRQRDASLKNIIIIMSDNQGYGDLGFTGNPVIKTPVLDNLAEESVRFTSFYTDPVCAPTRSSLLTGRYSLRTGVYDTYNGGAIMDSEELTIAEILKNNGYKTGIFGKWHLGDNYPFRPIDQGFTTSLVHRSGGMGQIGDIANYFKFDSSYFDPVLYRNGKKIQTYGYCTDVFTDAAIRFLQKNKGNPFFLYLPFNVVHTPAQVPQVYYEMYKDIDPSNREAFPDNQPFPRDMTERETEGARRVYGMVTNMDDNLGKLFAFLEKHDLEKNTLIIFLSDNGPQQRRYNGGLRYDKSWDVYEGGIHVPCVMKLKGEFPSNKKIDIPCAHIDVFPTILDVCNITLDEDIRIDGESLLPLIHEENVPWVDRPLYFQWDRSYPGPYRNFAVRRGDFKLVGHAFYNASVEDMELYNLQRDPFEQENILSSHKEIAYELKSLYDLWYDGIIESPHLIKKQFIKVGSDEENPVLLNRNDAKGETYKWEQLEIFGYWDIEVVQEGSYDFVFHFHKPINNSGMMSIRMGTLKRTIDNEGENTTKISMPGIDLKPGIFQLETWYSTSNQAKNIFPFYVEIFRNNK
jgi:arylsulfatase